MSRRARPHLEALEVRAVPSTVSWISSTSGAWTTAADWSTLAVPGAGDDVVINESSTVTVTLAASTSINSLSVTGATLDVTGGTLAVATNSSNDGSIQVQPGAHATFAGNYSQSSAGSLTLPAAGLSTGVGTNLLANTGFESPSVATTAPTSWSSWGTSYLSTQYAHTGAQSLEASGPNSGVLQSFSVTPGASYTGTVYAMTPAGNQLTGPEGAFLQVMYYDSGGNLISSYTAPNSVEILNSNSPSGGPISGSVGTQGWNYFDTTTVAPANAATVNFVVETGAYTGLSGTAGGAVFWDDPQFGPTAANAGTLSAVDITNNGIIAIGAGDTVATSGTFTQTTSGTLDIQLGGPRAGGLYGSLSSAGAATLAGTLGAAIVNGYSPAVNDDFNALTYSSVTGAFAAYQLPSGSSYSFTAAVNPTYVGLGAVPMQLAATINAGTVLEPVATNMVGVNLAWWDDKLTTPETQQMVEAAGLSAFRFPGGSSSDDYHFDVSNNFDDSSANTIPQFAQFIEGVGGIGLVTLDYGSGSPQEAAAELAYLEGSPSDTTVIGTGLEWNDSTNQWQQVNWQTVGYWASLRAATPLSHDDGYNFLRIDHPAPFGEIKYWEVGNEEYGSWEIDHHGTPGPGGVSTGAQHDPATYAAFAETFATFAAEIDAGISIGIDSGDPTGASDNDWTNKVLTQGLAIGFVPGFLSDHSYMQGPGQESDSNLLLDTVSDPNSVLDWSTRHADYQSLLQRVLGSKASSVNVMATEFNSVYTNPGKQSTSLVNGLFIADSIGSLLDSGYTGGFVWALRNSWDTTGNNSPSLYGWRQGGDYGLLGDPNTSDPPSTGPYVPYPGYFAEQLASKIVQAGGQVVSASSNFQDLTVYAVLEPDGHLELLVINKDPDANLNEQFTLQSFTPPILAQAWQYGEAQDTAQSGTTDGHSGLASFTASLNVSGSTFSYSFPAYSMTVLDLGKVFSIASGPNITQGAAASPSPIDGVSTVLSVSATDPAGASSLTYTWATTGSSPAPVSFSANANGAARSVTATFSKAGSYTFEVTVRDPSGAVATSSVTATVNSTVSTIRVSPASITVPAGGLQAFTGAAYDQFGTVMSPQPALSWSVSQGSGTIDVATGVYVAPGAGGTATVQASSGGVRGQASVTITALVTITPPRATGAAATVRYTDAADWNTGFLGEIMITNLASAAFDSWTLAFVFAHKITVIWGATIVERIGSHYLVRNEPSSGSIAPGESVSFGFQGKPGRAGAGPTNYVFDGVVLPTPAPSPESPRATTQFVVASESRKSFAATLLITNTGVAPIGGWALQFNFAARITSTGGAAIARHAGSRYVLRDVGSDAVIAPGQSVRVTLKGAKRKRVSAPTVVLLDGVPAEDTAGSG